MLVMVVCDIRGELSTDGYQELFWICLASANIVPIAPLQLGISDGQKFSHHFVCDTTSLGHRRLPLITKHLQVWGLCLPPARELSHKPGAQLDGGYLSISVVTNTTE